MHERDGYTRCRCTLVPDSQGSVFSMQLRSSRLIVDIAPPGSIYRRSRFDWTAFITQVTLDHQHTYCCPESRDGTGSGGHGLCNEFGILGTPGFDEAADGDLFPKLGVGLLTRPDRKPYSFSRDYHVQPFPVEVSCSDDLTQAQFTLSSLPCRDFAFELHKSLRVAGHQLTIDYVLSNTGKRPVMTEEYVHNFLAPNGLGPQTGATLITSFPLNLDSPIAGTTIALDRLRWTQNAASIFYSRISQVPNDVPSWWELRHPLAGLGLREETSVPWHRMAIYGTADLVSPEAFVPIHLQPGQQQAWSRKFTFFRLDEQA